MDTSTSMEVEDSFHSNTDATIYPTSDHSQSLLSDPNIASSPSTSADDQQQPHQWTAGADDQQQPHQWTAAAAVGCTDDLSVSVSSASSRTSYNKKIENVEHLNLSKAKEQVQLEALPKDLTSSRTRIKVHMQGVAVGRAVDLTVLSGYDDLISELEELFDMKGELSLRIKWQVVYMDDEGDMMLVGDYPWPEFCEMVRKLYILVRK